jgi:hypothetical protein
MDTNVTRATLESAVLAGMDAAAASPMQWGTDDCALWCANILREPLGYDAAARWRGRYSSRRGAVRALGRSGLVKAIKDTARLRKWKRIDPRQAQAGDVGMAWVNGPDGKPVLATVICRTRGWFVGRSENGWTALKAELVAVAWSVLPDALPGGPGPRVRLDRVLQEPISTAIGLTALIGGLGVSTAVAGAIGGAIIGSVISVGLSLASSLLLPQQGGSLSNPTDFGGIDQQSQGVQVTARQAIPYKRYIVGEAYVGGALFYEHVSPPYLTMGQMLSVGPIDSVQRSFIGTNLLEFPQLVSDTVLTPANSSPDYVTNLRASYRYGDDDQAIDPLIQTGSTLIPGATGTTIGTFDSLNAAFDGNYVKDDSLCTRYSGTGFQMTIGKDWGLGVTKTIKYFVVTAPSSGSPNMLCSQPGWAVVLQGSTDNFSSSIVTLGSFSAGNWNVGQSRSFQSGIDTSTAYRYHRLLFTRNGVNQTSTALAQVSFYGLAVEQSSLAEFRQRGIATAVMQYNYGGNDTNFKALWGQVARPNAYHVVRGVRAYDPRDPSQDIDDESTWRWTRNAALIQNWYLTRPFGGRKAMSDIRWDKVAISANYDDSVMRCADGTYITLHTIDGVITLDQPPYQVMQQLLTANRGMVIESCGQMWVQSSYPRTPVATIHDRILVGGITYQAQKPKSELVNKLQVRFVAPEQEYQVADGPILDRTDLQALDGTVLTGTLSLNYTQDNRRAQRLQKAFLDQSRLGRTVTCTVDIRLLSIAADELIGSVLTVASVLFSKMNGDYLVTAVGFADDCTTLSLALSEYDSTIETSWNPDTDEQPFELAQIDLT